MILTFLPLFPPPLSPHAPEGGTAITGSWARTLGHSHFPTQQQSQAEKQHKFANFASPGIEVAAYRSQTRVCSSITAKFTVKGRNTKGRKHRETFTKIKTLYQEQETMQTWPDTVVK